MVRTVLADQPAERHLPLGPQRQPGRLQGGVAHSGAGRLANLPDVHFISVTKFNIYAKKSTNFYIS